MKTKKHLKKDNKYQLFSDNPRGKPILKTLGYGTKEKATPPHAFCLSETGCNYNVL